MTVEELKEEAKKLGYNIIKIKKTERLLPCTCGNNRREHWHGINIKSGMPYEILKCTKCGKEVKGDSKDDAIKKWNEMIKKEESNAEKRSKE